IELSRGSTRKIGSCGPVIGHKQSIANEYRVTNLVGNTSRCVPGRINNFSINRAKRELFATLKEMVELRSLTRHIQCIKNRPEYFLDLFNVFPNPDSRAALELEIGRRREMI